MDDDYNSPVAFEVPVYISQSLGNQLVVYQAPLEDQLRNDDFRVHECSIRDDYVLAIDEEIDTNSANYDSSKGEQMAINTDGDKNIEERMFPKRLMDKRILISKMIPNRNIAVGIIQDGELHLTPAIGAAALRPTFRYLDQRSKNENKEKSDDVSEEDEEMKQVTVKFARQETEYAKKSKEKAFRFLTKQDENHRWKRVDYHDASSSRSEITLGKLFCDKPGNAVGEPLNRRQNLLKSLKIQQDNGHGLPLTQLRSLPLLDRIKMILMEARLVDLTTINRLLGEPASSSELHDRIKVVQHVAVLVQGCWVIQSDIAIAKDTAPNGVPAVLAKCARDYILYLFTKNRCLSRKTIMEMVKLPGEVVKIILEEVSSLNGNKEWEFSLPTDHQFIHNHSDVVQRQQAKWELRLEPLLVGLRPPEASGTTGGRNRRRSGRDSFSSDNEESRRNYPGHKVRRTARTSESRS